MKTPHAPRLHRAPAFTLIEILVVIAIIAVLATMTVGGMGFVKRKAAINRTKVLVGSLSRALEEYNLDNRAYPAGNGGKESTHELYAALYGDNDGDGKPDSGATVYLDVLSPSMTGKKANVEEIGSNYTIIDAWKEPIHYRHNPSGSDATMMNPDFDLWSLGPDSLGGPDSGNKEDTADDIDNW